MSTETNTIKPIHVAGYVRNKKQIEAHKRRQQAADTQSQIIAVLMVGSIVVLIAVIFWQITLTIAAAVLLGLYAKKRFKVFIAQLKAEVGDITIYRDGKEQYIWQKRVLKLASVTGAI